MKIERRPDGSVVIRQNPVALMLLLGAFGASIAAAVGLDTSRDPTRTSLGLLCALLPFSGLVFLERVAFDFDATRRRLRWSRRSLLRHRSGELSFDDVLNVQVQVGLESDTESRGRITRSYRVVLGTRAGDLHLTNRPFYDEAEQQAIAQAIRGALGRP